MVEDDERGLVAGLKAGNRATFGLAIRRYSPKMLATARAIVGVANAEDIVQEAWLSVFQQIDRFEQRASLNTWLQRIVVNRAVSWLRSRSHDSTAADVTDGAQTDRFDGSGHWLSPPVEWDMATPDALLSAADLQDCIDKHLLLMPANQREVVVMRDMLECSFEEICNELQLTASNVRVLLHRGRTRLMSMVDRFQDTGSC